MAFYATQCGDTYRYLSRTHVRSAAWGAHARTVIHRVPGAHVLGGGRHTYVPSISEHRRVRESTSSVLELMQGARAGGPGVMHARHSVTSCRPDCGMGLWHGTYLWHA